MKTKLKLVMSALVMLGIMIITNACNKETQQGYMTVKMTDAPADYLAVNVEITGLFVITENGNWINVPVKAGIYNLLELQNNVTVVLADDVTLPIGYISQVRLMLGSNNYIVTTMGQFDLKIPSGEESGLKINLHENIEDNEHVEVVLDFDASASIVENGNGNFILKPVIKVKSITQLLTD